MKKNVIWIAIVFVIIIGGFFTYEAYLKRTPEKILLNQFGISLKGYNYSIISHNEQWDYNGDGYCLILFDLAQLDTQEFNTLINDNFKELPIDNELEVNDIPEIYLKSQDGYYIFQVENEDSRDFRIFIINTKLKKGILYYQIM
jgi:hypothetical protein